MSHIPDWASPLDTEGTGELRLNLSRRRLLKGSAVAGALALGSGTAAAAEPDEPPEVGGQGGQAMVNEDDHKDEPFEILEWADPEKFEKEIGLDYDIHHFTCGRPGKGITLVGWYFEYESDTDEDPVRTLYTRDNRIDTTVTYEWTPGGQECPGTEKTGDPDQVYLQKGYVAGQSRQ